MLAFAVTVLSAEEKQSRDDTPVDPGARICGSCGSTIDSRQMRRQHVVGWESPRDDYPIRQSWTFVIPPTATDLFAARKER